MNTETVQESKSLVMVAHAINDPSTKKVTIYTRAACHPNPGTGGWAFVTSDGKKCLQEWSGSKVHATNHQMELRAVIEGLKANSDLRHVTIATGADYVLKGVRCLRRWRKNNWSLLTGDGVQIKNKEDWQELFTLIKGRRRPRINWIRLPKDSNEGRRASRLAHAAREKADGECFDIKFPPRWAVDTNDFPWGDAFPGQTA